jgi:hypothetical protein
MTTQPPMASAPAPQLRPLGVGDIVDRVFAVYRAKPGLFLALAAIPYVVLVLVFVVIGLALAATFIAYATTINQFVQGRTPTPAELAALFTGMATVGLVIIIIAFVILSAQSAALVAAMAARYLGRDIELGQALRQGLRAAPRLIGAGLLILLLLIAFWAVLLVVAVVANQVLVAILAGLIAFVGTIYILASTLVMPVVATLEGAGPIAALRRSWDLSSGNRWRILGLQALLGILNLVISTLLSALFVGTLISDQATRTVLQQIVNLVANVAWAPVQWGTFAVLYYDLRVRREAFDLQLAAEALPREP